MDGFSIFSIFSPGTSLQIVWKISLVKLVFGTLLEAFEKNISIVYIFCWIISRCGSLKYFKINFAWSTVSPLICLLRLFFTPGSFLSSYFSLLLLFCLIYFSKISLISRLNHWLSFSLIIFSFSVLFLRLLEFLCITS